MPHRIALVDDHHMVREGLATTINGFPEYEVVIEAAHGEELIAALGSHTDVAIAVVDLHMPVMDGYATIAWLKANRPDTRSLALTFDASEDALVKALRAGAHGFLRKNARSALLKQALDSLIATGRYQPDTTTQHASPQADTRRSLEKEREKILDQITARELEFLHLVCDAEEPTYEAIADRMGVQVRTVDSFRQSLFSKFQIKSKAGLVLFAFKWRIIDP